jgi:hypothetical protein
MNELETFNRSDFETLTHDQRQELTAHLSSHIIQTEISTFENSLKEKVSKIGYEIKNDPDVKELKNVLDTIKTPLEHETIQNFDRINFIKQQILESKNQEPVEEFNNFDYDKRRQEIKTKLNKLYKRIVDSVTSINFGCFADLKYPSDLRPSFDR